MVRAIRRLAKGRSGELLFYSSRAGKFAASSYQKGWHEKGSIFGDRFCLKTTENLAGNLSQIRLVKSPMRYPWPEGY
jgi:hypothetical protein